MSDEIKIDLALRGNWTSASNAEADELCHGRHQAQKGIPDKESEDAAFGNAIHLAMKTGDNSNLTTEQESIRESMEKIEDAAATLFYPQVIGVPEPPAREQRHWIRWANNLMHSAQIDCFYIIGNRALIFEYKSLPGALPSSSKNLQLRDQAVILHTNAQGLKEIGVVVVQPLVTHTPEICVYQTSDLDRARDDLYRRVWQSNQPDAKRTPGEVQCKFCKARGKCPEYQAFAGSLVLGATQSNVDAIETVKNWTPAQRTDFMARVAVAQKWIDECKEEIRALLEKDPNAVPGYELNGGRNNPTIINPEKIYEDFSKMGGTLADFMKCVEIGKGKLTEAVKAVSKLKGAKLDAAVKGVIGSNVVNTKTRHSIVRKQ